LGTSFIEMNGRAFVKSVQPHSPQAARAGVLPRDSIQFASLYHITTLMIQKIFLACRVIWMNRRRPSL
jgi:hypothetical protein